MQQSRMLVAGLVLVMVIATLSCSARDPAPRGMSPGPEQPLPVAPTDGDEVAEAIFHRRSQRSFTRDALSPHDLADLLWSTIGVTVDGTSGATRAAPSAGATNPLIVYAVVQRVEEMQAGIYRYEGTEHSVTMVRSGPVTEDLVAAALGQGFVGQAPLVLILTADFARTTNRYGERGERYVFMEAGHAAQNVCLMAQTRGLGTTVVGAFRDDVLKKLLAIDEEPLLIIPVGKPER